jgi:hypothetical protein
MIAAEVSILHLLSCIRFLIALHHLLLSCSCAIRSWLELAICFCPIALNSACLCNLRSRCGLLKCFPVLIAIDRRFAIAACFWCMQGSGGSTTVGVDAIFI